MCPKQQEIKDRITAATVACDWKKVIEATNELYQHDCPECKQPQGVTQWAA